MPATPTPTTPKALLRGSGPHLLVSRGGRGTGPASSLSRGAALFRAFTLLSGIGFVLYLNNEADAPPFGGAGGGGGGGNLLRVALGQDQPHPSSKDDGEASRNPAAGAGAGAGAATLATRESFGFFDDIPDAEWRLRQERARAHRHQSDPRHKDTAGIKNAWRWVLNNYYPLFSCPHVQRVGVGGDGPKWVCDPHRLKKKKEREEGGGCLIYSVGCNGDYTFEDALADLVGVGNCEIHVFDVFPKFDRPDGNSQRGIHFHPWGLSSSYRDKAGKGYDGPVMTLRETMKKLGHEGRTLDMFKIDCEGCEWTTYKDWISDDVDIRQLLIETHSLAEGTGVKPSDFFDDIQRAGFAMFSKEPNIHPQATPGCTEWSFVKLDRAFFGGNSAGVSKSS